MLNEQQVLNYLNSLITQRNVLLKSETDPYEDEYAHENKELLSEYNGKIVALNCVLEILKPVIKRVIKFTMCGASDDLIELEGDISDEIGAYNDTPMNFYLSDGTVGSIEYTGDGVWEIKILIKSITDVNIIHPTQFEIDADTNYTDKAEFTGSIDWILFENGKLIRLG